MKKFLSILLSIILMISVVTFPSTSVKAAGALGISVDKTTVNIGDSVVVTVSVPDGGDAEVLVSYPTKILQYVSTSDGLACGGDGAYHLSVFNTSGYQTITLKAISAGNASISVERVEGTDDFGPNSASVTVANVASGSSSSDNGSNGQSSSDGQNSSDENTDTSNGDNSLSSLSISAGSLSPAFSYGTTNYSATVGYDVTSIAVSAIPNNPSATVTSVTGNEDLQVGDNVIQIVVKAGNGVTATYTIHVTRKSESEEDDSESEETETSQAKEFQVNGQTLHIETNIPEEMIPADFTPGTVNIDGTEYACLNFANGTLTLLYLVSGDAEGESGLLYIYDAQQNTVYPFVCIRSEKHYIIPLLPNVDDLPEGYVETLLQIEGKGIVNAYQKTDSVNQDTNNNVEPNTQTQDTQVDNSLGWMEKTKEQVAALWTKEELYAAEISQADLYLMYCMNDQGETGWYQYDNAEGTYQRYAMSLNTTLTDSDNASAETDVLNQMKELKKKNTYLIFGMIFGFAVLIIVIINLLIGRRERKIGEEDYDEEDYEDEGDEEDAELEQPEETEGLLEDSENMEEQEIPLGNSDLAETIEESENLEEPDNSEESEVVEESEDLEESEKVDKTEESEDLEESEKVDKAEDLEDVDSTDEIEIEFYEMETEDQTMVIPSNSQEDEQFGKAAAEVRAKYNEENVRVTKRNKREIFAKKEPVEQSIDQKNQEFDLNQDGKLDEEEVLAATVAKIKEAQEAQEANKEAANKEESEKEEKKTSEKKSLFHKKATKEAAKGESSDEDDDLEFLDLN